VPVMPARLPDASPSGLHSLHDCTQLIADAAGERVHATIARLPCRLVEDWIDLVCLLLSQASGVQSGSRSCVSPS
jgi:hypothetical protein